MADIRDDRGEAVTETVLLVPALMFLIMLIIQFGLWYHAQHAVQAAASEGVRAARAETGTGDDGVARAEAFLNDIGPRTVVSPNVKVVVVADQATVEVSGAAPAVVPGLRLPVHASATSSLERFTP